MEYQTKREPFPKELEEFLVYLYEMPLDEGGKCLMRVLTAYLSIRGIPFLDGNDWLETVFKSAELNWEEKHILKQLEAANDEY